MVWGSSHYYIDMDFFSKLQLRVSNSMYSQALSLSHGTAFTEYDSTCYNFVSVGVLLKAASCVARIKSTRLNLKIAQTFNLISHTNN